MASQPKRVLLFGKTGDGKSTVANMLVRGDVDGEFAAGNSLAAITKQTNEFVTESNWTIIDTVGLFATDKPDHDHKRIQKLRNYVAEKHKQVDMFCYIKKASKFTRADEQCWEAFHTLFADNGDHPNYHDNVLLVFTFCRPGWLDENKTLINDMMSAPVLPNANSNDVQRVSYRSIGVDFPPHDEDPMIESKLEHKRAVSLADLKSAIEEAKQPLELHTLPGPG